MVWWFRTCLWGSLVLMLGCVGEFGMEGTPSEGSGGVPGESGSGPMGSDPPPVAEQPKLECAQGLPQANPSILRRLSPSQYLRSVSDLLDLNFVAAVDHTESIYATELAVRRFDEAAQLLETDVLAGADLTSCDIAGPADRPCVESFVSDFGRRAFRRPVNDEERTLLLDVYDEARVDLDHASSVLVVMRVMLQAPQFLYRIEVGDEDASLPAGMRRLSGFERATRLSYFLLGTTPDQALLEAAAAGSLDTVEGVREQAERILAQDAARAAFRGVITDWLHLDGATVLPGLDETPKYAGFLGTNLGDGLRAAMREDVLAFAERTVFDAEGSFRALLTGTEAFVTPELASIYGVSGEGWVDLGPARAGVLTRAAWLTVHASQRHQSPIRRGAYMVRHFLCMPLSDPPPDVDDTPLEAGDQGGGEALTVREATTQKTNGDTCKGCHRQINSLGFAFEHFDALGRWHDVEEDKPVNASATVVGTDVDGEVDGAADLMTRLVDSGLAQSCFADRFFEAAVGRALGELDSCSKERVMASFAETGDVQQLLVDIATSDAFLYINGAAPAELEETK